MTEHNSINEKLVGKITYRKSFSLFYFVAEIEFERFVVPFTYGKLLEKWAEGGKCDCRDTWKSKVPRIIRILTLRNRIIGNSNNFKGEKGRKAWKNQRKCVVIATHMCSNPLNRNSPSMLIFPIQLLYFVAMQRKTFVPNNTKVKPCPRTH